MISSFTDTVFGAQSRMFQGQDFFGAYKDAISAPLRGLSADGRKEFGNLLGVGLEGGMGDYLSRFNAQDYTNGKPGKMARAMGLFFKLNGLGPWTDANKRGMGMIISNDLATQAGKTIDQLDPMRARMLEIYGIDAKQWNVIRAAVKDAPDGRKYIMPGDIDDVSGAVFTGMSKSQQDALKQKARENLFTLIVNEVDTASPTPGARERAIMRRGYQAGSGAGEALRFMGQFKSFGVTVNTKVWGRQVYGAGQKSLREGMMHGTAGYQGLANLIAMSTVFGYFIMQAKEMMKGREPRDFGPDTIAAAAMQAGGAGIYGDFLFGETNRYFGGIAETVIGPGIGAGFEAVDLAMRFKTGAITGDMEDLSGDAIRLLKSNTPFANLFYVKDAMDYMVWYQLMEMANPGYLRRMERRMEQENNQEYWLPPSSIVQRGGGFQ